MATPITFANIAFVSGMILWQSQPHDAGHASRLALSLEAKSDRYLDVQIVKAGKGKYRVLALPARQQDREKLAKVAYDHQAHNAIDWRNLYKFFETGREDVFIVQGKSGERYEIITDRARRPCSCGCPHFATRLRGTGVPCPHMIALALWLLERPVQPKLTSSEIARRRALDFE